VLTSNPKGTGSKGLMITSRENRSAKTLPLFNKTREGKEKKMTVEIGSKVVVHYKGTLNNGEEFDSSYSRNEPLSFTVGNGETIAGFDSAVVGMSIGEVKNITLSPSEGYGDVNPEAFQKISKNQFPSDFEPSAGTLVEGINTQGQKVRAIIAEVFDEDLVLDFNHPMAGKEMNFEIQLVNCE